MLKQGKNNSPPGKAGDAKGSGGSGTSGYQGPHDPSCVQTKRTKTTMWWNEPKPSGGKVNNDGANQRSGKVGVMPPTIGPRVA